MTTCVRESVHARERLCVCVCVCVCVCSDLYCLRTSEVASPCFRSAWKARVLGYVIALTRGLTSCL
jgi:hypothetical protein